MDTLDPPELVPRRWFLRQLGALFGLGAGVLLFQTQPAQATPITYSCCRDSTCPYCPGDHSVRYKCIPSTGCSGSRFCTCASDSMAPCYSIAC